MARAAGGCARPGADGAQRAVACCAWCWFRSSSTCCWSRTPTAWAVGVLMFSGFSDWADGKIARLVANQSSRLGELLDPAVDRIYMVTVPVALAIHGAVPWWIVHHADRPRRRAGGDAAGAAQPRPDRAAGHLHRQGRHVRADVGLPADPARPVGRAVEPRHPGLRLGVPDLGDGACTCGPGCCT